jgi:hypothetical protein
VGFRTGSLAPGAPFRAAAFLLGARPACAGCGGMFLATATGEGVAAAAGGAAGARAADVGGLDWELGGGVDCRGVDCRAVAAGRAIGGLDRRAPSRDRINRAAWRAAGAAVLCSWCPAVRVTWTAPVAVPFSFSMRAFQRFKHEHRRRPEDRDGGGQMVGSAFGQPLSGSAARASVSASLRMALAVPGSIRGCPEEEPAPGAAVVPGVSLSGPVE